MSALSRRVAARYAILVNQPDPKGFDNAELQMVWHKAMQNAKTAEKQEYIDAYRKNTDDPSLDDFEQYMRCYDKYGD